MEINQRLATIWDVFLQEKGLNLSKNSEFCDILTCPAQFHPLLSSSTKSWKKKNNQVVFFGENP